MNEITDERFSFFGLEIELWRIGNSPVAPKFNVISQPNDWVKGPSPGVDTPVQQLQLEYWTAFKEYVAENKSRLRIQKPLPQHWTDVAIGRSNFHLSATINTRSEEISVALILGGHHAKLHFGQLEQQRAAVEAEAGTGFDWRLLPNRKMSAIALAKSASPSDRENWSVQHQWLLSNLELFHRVFGQRVRLLGENDGGALLGVE